MTGISSWFVPTEVEERVGGAVTANVSPGMDSLSTVTAWDPPHQFSADSRDDSGEDGPTVATEWIVESTCPSACTCRARGRLPSLLWTSPRGKRGRMRASPPATCTRMPGPARPC